MYNMIPFLYVFQIKLIHNRNNKLPILGDMGDTCDDPNWRRNFYLIIAKHQLLKLLWKLPSLMELCLPPVNLDLTLIFKLTNLKYMDRFSLNKPSQQSYCKCWSMFMVCPLMTNRNELFTCISMSIRPEPGMPHCWSTLQSTGSGSFCTPW